MNTASFWLRCAYFFLTYIPSQTDVQVLPSSVVLRRFGLQYRQKSSRAFLKVWSGRHITWLAAFFASNFPPLGGRESYFSKNVCINRIVE